MLMKLDEYRLKFFSDESRPHLNTIRNWVRAGKLPVEKRGRTIYVDTDKLESVTGNKLVDRVLADGGKKP